MAPGDLSNKHFICNGLSPDCKGWSQFHQQRQREAWASLSFLCQPTIAGPARAEVGKSGEGVCSCLLLALQLILLPAGTAEFLLATDESQSSSMNFYSGLLRLI